MHGMGPRRSKEIIQELSLSPIIFPYVDFPKAMIQNGALLRAPNALFVHSLCHLMKKITILAGISKLDPFLAAGGGLCSTGLKDVYSF